MAGPSQDWQSLMSAGIWRRHQGDLEGAIDAFLESIQASKRNPKFAVQTEVNLNYLADLHLANADLPQAEAVIREAIGSARQADSPYLGDHLLILARIQMKEDLPEEALESAHDASRAYARHNQRHGLDQTLELIEEIEGAMRQVRVERI